MTTTSRTEAFGRAGSADGLMVVAVALVAAAGAAASSAQPTGSSATDAVLVALVAGVTVWAAASAPRWAPTAMAVIAAAIAVDVWWALAGVAAALAGLGVAVWQHRNGRDVGDRVGHIVNAAVAGVAVNVLLRSELAGVHGLSAIIGVSVCAVVVVLGLLGRGREVRRVSVIVVSTVLVAAVLALVGVGAVGVSARPDLADGAGDARDAITQLNDGNYERAAELFESSSDAFARSDDRLGGVLAAPSLLIPGVAQNVRAGAELSAAAATGTAEAAAALRAIDPASLTVVDGAIDLDAIAAVESPLLRVQTVLNQLQATSDEVASPWLLAPVQEQLVELDERLSSNEPSLENALDAVRLAPQMLGGDGVRRYLVLFATPVEARGVAGFIGNYAVVEADEGRIEVTEFGRRDELEDVVRANGASCAECPPEVLDRYGRFGFVGGDANNGFGPRTWSSITLPAHFPYVGESAQVIFPQSGGGEVDGVIAIDPYVIEALMRYTGPIEVPDLDFTLQPDGAADYLLREQYLLTDTNQGNADRVDALETVGTEVIRRLLSGSLPEPSTLARDLGPLAAEQRLLVWTDDPDEQALLDQVGMLGALPPLGDDGGFAVMVSNAGHSKIDWYLDRTVDVAVETGDDGERTLVAEVTLTNNAPSSGLPAYVIGNDYGLASGTSRLWVNFFGPDGLLSATRNGESVELERSSEAGWQAYEYDEQLASGESVSFRLEFELGPAADGVEQPVRWTQPLASRDS